MFSPMASTRTSASVLFTTAKRAFSCISAKHSLVRTVATRWRCHRGIASQIMAAAIERPDVTPLVDAYSRHAYRDLICRAACLADILKRSIGDVRKARVCLLMPKDHRFVDALLAVWMCGLTGVPLCPDHPASMWRHCVTDSEASAILCSAELSSQLSSEWSGCHVPRIVVNLHQNKTPLVNPASFPRESDEFYTDSPALILYTSGTTGLPKGVVISHSNLTAQCMAMRQAWQWSSADSVLHVLPLHHTHGLVNALLTPLSVSARCILMSRFDPVCVWQCLLTGGVGGWGHVTEDDRVTMLMAVPTIYSRLLQQYQLDCSRYPAHSRLVVEACSQVRLMVSGSAALPQPIMQQWLEATGHTLLERYGMTEIGMALSNPLYGTRTPGAVGSPMPSVEVRLARFSEDGTYTTTVEADSRQCRVLDKHKANEWGELLVRGPSVSSRYWRPGSAGDFLPDGWFRTGDTACVTSLPDGTDSAPAVFSIVGRTSVDIIKSGGYKVSALAIERVLLQHGRVQDVAVVGLPDPHWGERIVAVIAPAQCNEEEDGTGTAVSLEELRSWCSQQLPRYSLPSQLILTKQLPRNVMGKINKKQLARQIQQGGEVGL